MALFGLIKKPKLPPIPKAEDVLAQQSAADKDFFKFALRASTPDTTNPFGSRTTQGGGGTFDQAGFDAAVADFNRRKAADDAALARAQEEAARSGRAFNPASVNRLVSDLEAAPTRADFTRDQSTLAFNPQQQALFDAAQAGLQRFADNAALGNVGDPVLAKALFDRQQFLVDPQVEADRRALETRLIERGFQPQAEGAQTETNRFEDAVGRQRTDSSNAATVTSATLAQQLAQTLSGLQSAQRAGLEGNPSQIQVPGIAAPNVGAAQTDEYNRQVQQANARAAFSNQLVGAIGTAVATYFGGPQAGALANKFSRSVVNANQIPESSGTGLAGPRTGFFARIP